MTGDYRRPTSPSCTKAPTPATFGPPAQMTSRSSTWSRSSSRRARRTGRAIRCWYGNCSIVPRVRTRSASTTGTGPLQADEVAEIWGAPMEGPDVREQWLARADEIARAWGRGLYGHGGGLLAGVDAKPDDDRDAGR